MVHIIDVAVHQHRRVKKPRLLDCLDVGAHTLLQALERQEVDVACINAQVGLDFRPYALVVCSIMSKLGSDC